MIITDEMDEFLIGKSDEWSANQRGCNCPSGNPPCSYCEGGYSLPLEEYLQLALEWEYGDDIKPNTNHEDFDHAMKDLF